MINSAANPSSGAFANSQEQRYRLFLSSLLAGDEVKCAEITEQILAADDSILSLYQNLYQRALYKVGELWQHNRISVATEHLATAIIEGLLSQIYPRIITHRRTGQKTVIATVERELHQVGCKMVCDVFEMNGWDAIFLGATTPKGEWRTIIHDVQPDLVGLSLTVYFLFDTLRQMIQRIRSEFPDLPVVLGGQGFRHDGKTVADDYPNVLYMASLDELDQWIKLKTAA